MKIVKRLTGILFVLINGWGFAEDNQNNSKQDTLLEVHVNQIFGNTVTVQGKAVSVCYTNRKYIHRSRQNENLYQIFILGPKLALKAAVGMNGANIASDVKLVQKYLKKIDLYRGSEDGKVSKRLIRAIKEFQDKWVGIVPDGRIGMRGKSIRILWFEMAEKIFIRPLRKNRLFDVDDSVVEYRRIKECVRFVAPQQTGQFEVRYNLTPVAFASLPKMLHSEDRSAMKYIPLSKKPIIRRHLSTYPYDMEWMCDLNVETRSIAAK